MKNKNRILILLLFISLFTISFGEVKQEEKNSESVAEKEISEHFGVYDPWEPLNRRVYYFNYTFDKYIFLPVVDAYNLITPTFVQNRVTNFFKNSGNISTTGNAILQMKPKKAMRAWGRFSINATLGLFGLFDVASKLGMPKPYEDFGLTLAHYGVRAGPYLVLPILGPSNLRDAIGSGINSYALGVIDPYESADIVDIDSPAMMALQGIDKRKNTKFRYYASGSPFEYEYLRFFYKKYRNLQINNRD